MDPPTHAQDMDFLPPWLALSTAWSLTTDGVCESKSRATYLVWVGLRKMAEDASCEHGISPVVLRRGSVPHLRPHWVRDPNHQGDQLASSSA